MIRNIRRNWASKKQQIVPTDTSDVNNPKNYTIMQSFSRSLKFASRGLKFGFVTKKHYIQLEDEATSIESQSCDQIQIGIIRDDKATSISSRIEQAKVMKCESDYPVKSSTKQAKSRERVGEKIRNRFNLKSRRAISLVEISQDISRKTPKANPPGHPRPCHYMVEGKAIYEAKNYLHYFPIPYVR
mmetsp:Transcript_7393/g.10581  ORF Transcript_7393/g.10581 Transcript_7393/m.10581 type:complete len:186 (+) Transcript_7393:171-728(+)